MVTGVRVARFTQIGRMPRLMSTLRSRYVETMLLAEQINHTTPTPPASAGSGAAANGPVTSRTTLTINPIVTFLSLG